MKTKVPKEEEHYINEEPCFRLIDEEVLDYLPPMYGTAHDTAIDDLASLAVKVSDIYRRLTS